MGLRRAKTSAVRTILTSRQRFTNKGSGITPLRHFLRTTVLHTTRLTGSITRTMCSQFGHRTLIYRHLRLVRAGKRILRNNATTFRTGYYNVMTKRRPGQVTPC